MWNGAWIPGAMDMSIANSGGSQVFAPSDDRMELSPPSTPPVAQPPPAVVVVDTANPAWQVTGPPSLLCVCVVYECRYECVREICVCYSKEKDWTNLAHNGSFTATKPNFR